MELLGEDDPGGIADEDIPDAIERRINEKEDTRGITLATDDLKTLISQVTALSHKEVITEDDRQKIRDIIFNFKANPEVETIQKADQELEDSMQRSEKGLEDVPPHPSNFIFPDVIPKIRSFIASKFPTKGQEPGILNLDIPVKQFPKPYRLKISNLQTQITTAANDQKSNHRNAIWRLYLLCRSALLSQPKKVPLGFWSGLWIVFSKHDDTDPLDRMAHIKYIGDDLCKVGVRMDANQALLYLESLMFQGELDHAVELWTSIQPQMEKDGRSKYEHIELGVKLFCQRQQIDRALEIAESVLRDKVEPSTHRLLIPIMRCCLALSTPDTMQIAWAIYLRLRVNLGSEIQMVDYDTMILSFLEAERPDMALAAFKDMMLKPGMSKSLDSTSTYGISAAFGSSNEENLTKFNTHITLPPEFNNKFFFGSWLKKLIGEGELSAALRVNNFMIERGICPDAKHVNGIIGALYRDGTSKSVAFAEELAWRMINRRLEFVKTRNAKYNWKVTGPLRVVESEDKLSHKNVALSPMATVETFCVLIQQYRRRQQHQAMVDLLAMMQPAEVKPNTFLMNEVLSLDKQSHDFDRAWDFYIRQTTTGGVRPDFETFGILWRHLCQMTIIRGHLKKSLFESSRRSARPLFAQLMKHKDRLPKVEPFPRDLYNSILHGFSLSEDTVGTAVALNALQEHFGMAPTEETARTIILQLARLGQTDAIGRKARRLGLKEKSTQARIARVTAVLQELKRSRDEALFEQGVNFQDLTEKDRLGEAVLVLSNLLRNAFETMIELEKRKIATAPEVSKRTSEAMGVPDCSPWAADMEES
ncbi:putative pentatricopeptide repeat-containing protein, mitochondrial [Amylocarpus encephaloides]|uniref:Pentatricopeptide repeat-containing protein, mitochondrial n=1 Tax=Amylocarpus encephaloides TaxID=45428 RepID=A0A9P7YAK6_9HELO|nr:putative pentatricopeptide repeat-containing protein, mitochondrial [Amylocarpus encephaloides]